MQNILNPTQNPVSQVVKKSSSFKNNLILGLVSLAVILLGIGTGYLASGVNKNGSEVNISSDLKMTDTEAGIVDENAFPDSTEGVLTEGGINGEGTHHLVRGSGPSQYAYLTSTVIDLDAFVGKKVQVWGQTISGKKAGWLMDVGMVKVID